MSRHGFDVSLVLNSHAGSVFMTRTLRSLEEAAFAARESGFRLELVFILNDSPPAHLDLARRYACAVYDDIVIVEVSRASLGGARQDGLNVARGEYICFADDDDLVSSNSIVKFYEIARRAGSRSIVVPQYLVTFGSQNYIAEYQGSNTVSPLAWIKYHPFISRIFLHASAIERLHYADVALGGGYAFEDWHFNAGAIARGYHFLNAPGTILFYRRRPAGLLAQFDLGAVRQIPPSPLFHPETYLRVCREAAEAFDGTFPPVDFDAVRRDFAEDPGCRVATFAANLVDPTIDWKRIVSGSAWINKYGDLRPGAAYYEACRILRGLTFDHVILCQTWSDPAAARRAHLLVDAVRAARPEARFLLLAGEAAEPPARLPAGTTTIDLGSLYPGVPDEDLDTVVLRIIENTAAARLHLLGGPLTRRFYLTYRKVLGERRAIYYRDADRVCFADHLPVVESPDIAFLSEVLPSLALVVGDCLHTMARDRACFGQHEDRWTHLYALPPARASEASLTNFGGDRRLLWITAADDPDMPVLIDYVRNALSTSAVAVGLTVLDDASRADLTEDSALARYDCVLHTACVENLPMVLLDALAAGVPVVALASGGVAEAVIDGETGWLIQPGPTEVVAPLLVEAIRQCYRGGNAYARRAAGAIQRAAEMRKSGGGEALLAAACKHLNR